LFAGLSWGTINAACPSGNCTTGATLHGYDMTGWVWAGVDAVASMFNFYLSGAGVPIADQIYPDWSHSYTEIAPVGVDASWIAEFFAEWRPTQTQVEGNYLNLADAAYTDRGGDNFGYIEAGDGPDVNLQGLQRWNIVATPQFHYNETYVNPYNGAFFYKADQSPEPSPAPTPATLSLIALALAVLGLTRRKKQLVRGAAKAV
jgi:hypothetical protein